MKKKVFVITALIVFLLAGLFSLSVMIAGRILDSGDQSALVGKEGVGLVEIKGMILDSGEAVRQIRYFLKKDSVKAVVLRIDSPGGVVAPAQEIYEEVRRFAAKKKIIVSMGSLAASGGYYIAAPATMIYANPGTITASIGVILKLSNIEGLQEKLGIKSYAIKTGKYKDSGSPSRPLSPEDRAMFQSVIDSTHEQFVKAVAEGRKLSVDDVRAIADGRILSGEQAKNHKLVDRLGTLEDAIGEAAKMAGISGDPEIIKPPRKKLNYLELFAGGMEERFGGAFDVTRGGLKLMYE